VIFWKMGRAGDLPGSEENPRIKPMLPPTPTKPAFPILSTGGNEKVEGFEMRTK
jgi:hypothetical protein